MIGQRLLHYEVVEKLGEGGFGVVYKARDLHLGRFVAVKVLPPEAISNADRRRRFIQEAKAASSLNHPNIVTIYDIAQVGGAHFIVMEYVKGKSLSAVIGRKGLGVSETLKYAIQITDALTKAHAAGVVHRDLKPGNIMITDGGQAKILDFGLAKLTEPAPDEVGATETISAGGPVTEEGTMLGTVAYMSPEQAEGKPVDERSDIFSFGTVLYEMVTGRRAFCGGSKVSILSAILREEPKPVSELGSGIPRDLEKVITRCLRKDPDRRFQHMVDVKLTLQELEEDVNSGKLTAAMPVGGAGPEPHRRARRRLRRAGWAVAGASLLLLSLEAVQLFKRQTVAEPVIFPVFPPERVKFGDLRTTGPVTVSPDGQRMAFVGTSEDGLARLWVRWLNALPAKPLDGTVGATYPFWSPDSRYLGFFADGKLKKVALTGGLPETLCDAPGGRGGAWSSRGMIVFSPANATSLQAVSDAGGTAAQATALDPSRGENTHRLPSFLPDGRHFFFVALVHAEGASIHVASIESPPAMRIGHLLESDSNAAYMPPGAGDPQGYVFFMRGSALMAQPFRADRLQFAGDPFTVAEGVDIGPERHVGDFSVSQNRVLVYRTRMASARRLAWFDRRGNQISLIAGTSSDRDVGISPDGEKIAVIRFPSPAGSSDIWLHDLVRHTTSRFTVDPGQKYTPLWSPDGRRIGFGLWSGSGTDIYLRSSLGVGEPELVHKCKRFAALTDWSADGRYILYQEWSPNGDNDLWALPVAEERRDPLPLVRTRFDDAQGQLSGDGRWLAYTSNESGKPEIYVQPFDRRRAEKWQISNNGGLQPRWRRDGRELFYISLDGRLMGVPVRRHAAFEAGVPVALFATRIITAGDDALTFYQYTCRADGQRFLISAPLNEPAVSAATVVLNWSTRLKP